MIGNITKGSNFRPLLKYLLEKEKAQLVCSNMFGKDYQSLAEEFKLSIALRPNVSQIVYHVSLSLDPKEKLNNRQWNDLARKYLKGMGFESSQFVAVKHSDRHHQHLHLVTSRVDLNGNTINTNNDYFRSQKVIRELEKEYKIREVPCSWELDRRQQTRQEIEEVNRTWEFSVRRHLQQTIDELVDYKSPLNVKKLLKHLEDRDVSHQVHYSEAGEMMGLSYSHKGVNFSGTSLGKAYTIGGLQKHRGVTCDRQIERDIYKTCTISPDTPQQTLELLHERELDLQKQELIAQQQKEAERIRLEAERIRLEAERIEKEAEAKRKEDEEREIDRQLYDEFLNEQRQIQRFEELPLARLEEKKARLLIEQKTQLIRDLAPVFIPAIEYTQLKGVPHAPIIARIITESTGLPFKPDPNDNGITVETKDYLITLSQKVELSTNISPSLQLKYGGGNCHNLSIEHKDRFGLEILSLNFSDYNKLDVDNVHIISNTLSENDIKHLQTLQKPLLKLKQTLELQRQEKELKSQLHQGSTLELGEAVLNILLEFGVTAQDPRVESSYNDPDLKIDWTQKLDRDRSSFKQKVRLFDLSNDSTDKPEPVLEITAKTPKYLTSIQDTHWNIRTHNVSEFTALKVFDLDRDVSRIRQARKLSRYGRKIATTKG